MGMPVPIKLPVVQPIRCRPTLPFHRPSAHAYTEILILEFLASRKPTGNSANTILNCAVVGPEICPYFHVVTRADYLPGHTVFRTNEGRDVASVEWVPNGGGAYVELYDKNLNLEKQAVSAWLGVSRDASYRMMYAHGQAYVWVPRSLSICLYEWDPAETDGVPRLLARISKEEDVVTLQISLAAIETGLLEMCVICVVLFQSGCRID
ncbi:hypothetical protein C8F04DRAFT_463677 [Mycena alexandri]|uniref:Uncharacterized protein n=1 Tax=Mycena alexandri TaxID=1745969 RepID=A0AAD6T0U0_9AGAR|nr:hypothetical protein C8F04DRAFT_463677 [Mycena alexandri]